MSHRFLFTAFISVLISIVTLTQTYSQLSLLKDINPGEDGCWVNLGFNRKEHIIPLKDNLAFLIVDDEEHGVEPWITDGTSEGTKLLKDIYEGPKSSFPLFSLKVGDKIFFFAKTEKEGIELWVTDGTTEGTIFLKDIYEGETSSRYVNVQSYPQIEYHGKYLFVAATKTSSASLFVSDGTPEGTTLIDNTCPACIMSHPSSMQIINDKVYFFLDDALYESDGTDVGTKEVINFKIRPNFFDRRELTAIKDKLYFRGGYNNETEPYISDGTPSGSKLLKDISPGDKSSYPTFFTGFDDKAFFTANNHIYTTDGTTEGTVPFNTRLYMALDRYNQRNPYYVFGDHMYFIAATDPAYGNLYRLDKGSNDAKMVIEFGGYIQDIFEMVPFNGKFFIEDIKSNELCVFDPDTKKHRALTDFTKNRRFERSPNVSEITLLDNKLIFFATTDEYGKELWTYDLDSFITSTPKQAIDPANITLQSNPVHDVLRVSLPDDVSSGSLTFNILNLRGQIVASYENLRIQGSTTELDIERLNPGVYSLQVVHRGKLTKTLKFLKL